MPAQCIGVPGPIDADDVPESSGAARLDARERILEDRCRRRLHSEAPCRREVRVGGGLAAQVLARGNGAVDADVEERGDSRRLEHLGAVGARGDDGARESRVPRGSHEPNGATERIDAAATDQLERALVLAVAERVDGLGSELDPARCKERAHAVGPLPAVHVLAVVVDRVEGHEPRRVNERPRAEELVERLLPRHRMDPRGVGEHAVQVE